MCLLAVLWRVVEDSPLIVAANREESFDRPGTPPQLVENGVRFVAGLDPRAGGTWLGVNAHGLLVAVTNGRKSKLPPEPRSRGLLVRDLLSQHRSARDAAQHATRELETDRYAGCNLLCGDVDSLHVIHANEWLRVLPLPPGIHVLAHGLVNSETDPRVTFALEWLRMRSLPNGPFWLTALQGLCALPASAENPPMCLRSEGHGTVSSSIVLLRRPVAASAYWHAQGPPDVTPYEDCSRLLKRMQ